MDSDEEIPMNSEEESDSYHISSEDDVLVEAVAECSLQSKKDYTVLREERMKQNQENDISEVSSVLSVSRGLACTLLLHKRWKVTSVFEDWFADEERVREAVGISRKEIPPKLENYCKVCMEHVDIESMLSAGSCGHLFCSDCWKAHVSVSINDGPGCLSLRCPEPKCKAIAGLDMVESLAAADDKKKFYNYLYRSYVESSKNRKWCPAPGCDAAVEFDVGGDESYDVSCDCSYKFCWNCTDEAHRPVSCATVAKWTEKNSSEANNTSWILSYTKPCPKCKRNIEKNSGCNHMTCSKPCGFEFCWLCLDVWPGYIHICNKFISNKTVEACKRELMRYTHYFERWMSNQRSRKIALGDLARARNTHIPQLLKVQGKDKPDLDLEFVVEAWDQIVECRRVLKWSYAYGFYNEDGRKTFLECLQGEAEAALERLHHCAEKEMEKHVEANVPLDDFGSFCTKLKSLTCTTRNYFENLVKAFENNLCEVESSSSRPSMSMEQKEEGRVLENWEFDMDLYDLDS